LHTLVQIQELTRKEFERGLEGVTDEDARKRIEPMNCISWIIGHVASQRYSYFVEWPKGQKADPKYRQFGFGNPASQPSLEEVMDLWQESCNEADAWLLTATNESLQSPALSPRGESGGTLLVRHIAHTWFHLGELISIRQILGHQSPQFVNMHDWSYDGT